MKLGTAIGLALGFGALGVAFLMEGGSLAGLLNPSAALIVFGGTFGATLVSFPVSRILLLPRLFKKAVAARQDDLAALVRMFVALAMKARREGLLSLEDEAEKLEDPFLKKGLLLVVDGTDPETIRSVLETEMTAVSHRHEACYGMLDAMGGFAPTMGIIGTVMGLISVLSHMEDPANIGPSIAVAFIATLYGVASANLIWVPLANNLKDKSRNELYVRELILDGLLSVMAGDNPHIVQQKMESFVPNGVQIKQTKPEPERGQPESDESMVRSAAS